MIGLPIFSPDLESGNPLVDPSEIVQKRFLISRIFRYHLSPDFALISLSRPLSMPDRKSSMEKRRGDKSRAPRDVGVVEKILSHANRLLPAQKFEFGNLSKPLA